MKFGLKSSVLLACSDKSLSLLKIKFTSFELSDEISLKTLSNEYLDLPCPKLLFAEFQIKQY